MIAVASATMRQRVAIACAVPPVTYRTVTAPVSAIHSVAIPVATVPAKLSHRKREDADGDTEDETEDEYAL
jgi:hypothetical protein